MVKKMVRLALACEYQRRPIRRADISEKVLGSSGGRQFKHVFNAAQMQLRSVFGMEMVELPAREKITLAQKRGMLPIHDLMCLKCGVLINNLNSRQEPVSDV